MKIKNWFAWVISSTALVCLALFGSGCVNLKLQHIGHSKQNNPDGSYTENTTSIGVSDPLTAFDEWANGPKQYGSTGGSSANGASSDGVVVWDHQFGMWRAKDSKLVMYNGTIHEVPKDHHLEGCNGKAYILDSEHHIETCGGSPWKVHNNFHTVLVDGTVKTVPNDPQLGSPTEQ